MGKVLKFLDGWKLVIFTLVLFASRIYDAAHNGHTGDIVGAVFAALGMTPAAADLDPVALGAAATGALAPLSHAAGDRHAAGLNLHPLRAPAYACARLRVTSGAVCGAL